MMTVMMASTTATTMATLEATTHLQARPTPAWTCFPRLVRANAQGRSRCAVCVKECPHQLLVLQQYIGACSIGGCV